MHQPYVLGTTDKIIGYAIINERLREPVCSRSQYRSLRATIHRYNPTAIIRFMGWRAGAELAQREWATYLLGK